MNILSYLLACNSTKIGRFAVENCFVKLQADSKAVGVLFKVASYHLLRTI